MLSPPDVETSTSLVLSGSGVPSPDAGVCTPAAPLPEKHRHPHATAAAGDLPHASWLFVYVFLGLDTFLGYAHYFDVICIILVCFSCLFVTLFLVLQMLI